MNTLDNALEAATADLPSDPPVTAQVPTNPDDMDSDDLLLQQARQELEAENNSTQTPPAAQTETPGTAPNGQQTQQNPAPQDPAPSRIMIPKERLDEVLSQKTERELRIAFLEGQLAARSAPQPAAPQPAAPPVQTVDQQLANVEQQIVALAEKFDAGDISAKDWRAQELALQKQADSLRDQRLLAKVAPPPKAGGDELYLQERTVEIEQQHPYVLAFQADEDFEWLRQKAQVQLVNNGVELKNDAPTKLMLRQAMAEIATQVGPRMFPDFKVPGTQPAPQPQPKAPSAAAAARDAKLDLRASLPPVLTDMPPAGGGGGQGGYTDDQILAMDEETLASLPKATRDAILKRFE